MDYYKTRAEFEEAFPHTHSVPITKGTESRIWCVEQLNLIFKEDFDIRFSHSEIGPGSIFFFKNIDHIIAFKLRW